MKNRVPLSPTVHSPHVHSPTHINQHGSNSHNHSHTTTSTKGSRRASHPHTPGGAKMASPTHCISPTFALVTNFEINTRRAHQSSHQPPPSMHATQHATAHGGSAAAKGHRRRLGGADETPFAGGDTLDSMGSSVEAVLGSTGFSTQSTISIAATASRVPTNNRRTVVVKSAIPSTGSIDSIGGDELYVPPALRRKSSLARRVSPGTLKPFEETEHSTARCRRMSCSTHHHNPLRSPYERNAEDLFSPVTPVRGGTLLGRSTETAVFFGECEASINPEREGDGDEGDGAMLSISARTGGGVRAMPAVVSEEEIISLETTL